MHIGIFGHYGNQNLGDEAIIEATIESVSRHFDEPEISCFSINPEDSAKRHGVPAYPIIMRNAGPPTGNGANTNNSAAAHSQADQPSFKQRMIGGLKAIPFIRYPYRVLSASLEWFRATVLEIGFLSQCYQRLKRIDLLIIAGSNQFLDNFGGVTGFPLTLLKWSVLCKLAGTHLAFVSVGAGPINSPASKLLIRLAIRCADYLSYRDTASRDLIEGASRKSGGKVYPDLASNLKFLPACRSREPSRKPIIGINPMPMYDSRYWCEADDGRYQSYAQKLAQLSLRFIELDQPVLFFGTQQKDYAVIEDILRYLPDEAIAKKEDLVVHASSVQDLMKIISGVDVVVATRFHGTVLSLLAGVPVFGICYYRKAADLLREMGQGDYYVMLDDFDVEEAFEKFQSLIANLEAERQRIERVSADYNAQVEAQYEHLASLFSR